MRVRIITAVFALLIFPVAASAQVQTITATHTYVMGDNDSRNDARQLCFLEAKRKVLEKAGSLIQTSTEVKNFQLTKDQISLYSAAVLSVETIKEKFTNNDGQNTLTLTVKADVDMADVRKRLQAITADKSIQERIARQQQQLDALEEKIRNLNSSVSASGEVGAIELRKERNIALGEIRDIEAIKLFVTKRLNDERELAQDWHDRVLNNISYGMTKDEVEQILGLEEPMNRAKQLIEKSPALKGFDSSLFRADERSVRARNSWQYGLTYICFEDNPLAVYQMVVAVVRVRETARETVVRRLLDKGYDDCRNLGANLLKMK